jgi:hypothetical protein
MTVQHLDLTGQPGPPPARRHPRRLADARAPDDDPWTGLGARVMADELAAAVSVLDRLDLPRPLAGATTP